MKTVLVTGAAGFIGYHLCEKLINLGYNVLGLDNINDYYDTNLKFARLEQLGISKDDATPYNKIVSTNKKGYKFKFLRLNLEDRENLPVLFQEQKINVVVNLAAQAGVRYSLENPETYIDSNIVGFLNILECCRHNNIEHLLYASSSSVYGKNKKIPFSEIDSVDRPISLYAATKKSNELMAYTYSHLYNIPTTGLRFFTVYGPWGRPDMAIFLFADAIANGRPIKVFNKGDMKRDFTYIDDIIKGIEIVLHNVPSKRNGEPPYELFNIGNGTPQSLMDFIEAIEKSLGVKAVKDYLLMQPGDVPRTWADTSNLNALGYESSTDLRTGVEKFVHWYKNYFK